VKLFSVEGGQGISLMCYLMTPIKNWCVLKVFTAIFTF
jgi:hypothetical protein